MEQEEIQKAVQVMQDGGIILYPTDTIWGIGCDATNEKAVEKIFKIKQRTKEKNLILLVESERRLQEYVEVPTLAWDLMDYSEKPLTIVYENPKKLPRSIISEDKTVGIRLTKDFFCKKLISKLNKPLVSTSANLSGERSPKNFSAINHKILEDVDYIINLRHEDDCIYSGSSIIKLTPNNKVTVIRQ
ncbi:L-threonylcarbamoyladenylate synthase [Apibacter muscae]|uniref:L-threonylcarbamoyladenylate synthase n=1 Tax=Apibacter muscae TaxID=2509004 RepID=UPI0021D2F70E|nr:L-threonylcarbamoyladenylate synthase [Apibacter muscae]